MRSGKMNRVGMKNLEMDKRVYELRCQVMVHIYEAKKLYPDMPRIEVRIVMDDGNILGMASLKNLHISIAERSIKEGFDLRSLVYHELVHTLTGFLHDDQCPLMKSTTNKEDRLSKQDADKLFKKYVGNRTLIRLKQK